MSAAPAPILNGHHPEASLEEMVPVVGAPRPVGGHPAVATGWAYVPDTVILHQAPGLTAAARTLYAILAAHADKQGACFPGMERLSLLLGRARSKVYEALEALEGLRWAQVERSTGQVNHYHLLLPVVPPYTAVARKLLYDDQLSPGPKHAYMLLARFQRYDELSCEHSVEELARLAGLPVTKGKNSSMERWLHELDRAGYLDVVTRHRGGPAARHVTLMPHDPHPKRSVRTRCLDKKGRAAPRAEPFVKDEGVKQDPPLAGHADPPLAGHGPPRSRDMQTPLQRDTNVPRFNVLQDNGPPLPRPRPTASSLEALNETPTAERADAAQPRHDAVASARCAEGGTHHQEHQAPPGDGVSCATSGASPSANAVSRTCAARSSTQSSVAKQVHPSAGYPSPNGPAAGRPADKTEVTTERDRGLVELRALRLADLDPTWPDSRQWRFQAEWAAWLFLTRVCGWKNTHQVDKQGRPLYPAYCDICFRIFVDMESNYERYEQWIAYMADPVMEEQFRKGLHPPRSYWHKQPEILWGEYRAWPRICDARSQMRLAGVEHQYDYDDCMGCLWGAEEDYFRATGEEHRPDCLYGRGGPVAPDDWRLSRLLQYLKEKV